MKKLKNAILALILIICASTAINAHPIDKPEEKKTLNYTLNKYIEGTTRGMINDFSDLLDTDFKLALQRVQKTVSFNRDQFLEDLKNIEGVMQQCQTTYTLLERNANFAMARVEMKYPDFTRVNCVNLSNTGNGWKITDVSTTFE